MMHGFSKYSCHLILAVQSVMVGGMESHNMTLCMSIISSTNLGDNPSNKPTIIYNQHEQPTNELPCAEKSGHVKP